MQTTTLKLYSLGYAEVKTYLITAAFVVGNILLPQLAHTVPQGGFIFLPIYFLTLVAAYKYGWKVGLLTAIHHLLFGMPPLAALPAILTKSVLLVLASGFATHYFKRISVLILALVVLSYQIFGTLVEWALIGDFFKAVQDFRLGLPGMALQIFGGYFIINYLIRK